MKLLVIADDFLPNPGGIAVFLHSICEQLAARGHLVDVLTSAGGQVPYSTNGHAYHIYHFTSPIRPSSPVYIAQTIRLHQRHHYDLVFLGHFSTTRVLGAPVLRRLSGVPYVILSHGDDLDYVLGTQVDVIAARIMLGNAALILSNSRFTAERIRERGYSGSLQVLNPGVNISRFHPGVDTTLVRQAYGLDGRRILLTTARLEAKKNVHGVLQALPLVIQHVPDLLYLIVGDGRERARLERTCDELGLRSHVLFLGHVPDDNLPALYCASDAFAMPSYTAEETGATEGFGISFVEANACGLPVVGGRTGGTPEAVIDGQTGLLVDPHNPDEIAAAITRLLTDRGLASCLGENGRRRVERDLTWEQVGRKLEGYLQEMLEPR